MNENTTCRIGIGGPVGSGKTALIEAITRGFWTWATKCW